MTQQPSGKVELHPQAQQAINRVKDLAARANAIISRLQDDAPPCYPDEVSAAMTDTLRWGHSSLGKFAPRAGEHAANAADGHRAKAEQVEGIDEGSAADIKASGESLGDGNAPR
jgi:hypothetical protein